MQLRSIVVHRRKVIPQVEVNLKSSHAGGHDESPSASSPRGRAWPPCAIRYYEDRGLIESERTTATSAATRRPPCAGSRSSGPPSGSGSSWTRSATRSPRCPTAARPPRRTGPGSVARWRARLDEQIRAIERLRDNLDGCIGCGCLSLAEVPAAQPRTTWWPTAVRARCSSTREPLRAGPATGSGAWRSTSWPPGPTRRCCPCPGTRRWRSGQTSTSSRSPAACRATWSGSSALGGRRRTSSRRRRRRSPSASTACSATSAASACRRWCRSAWSPAARTTRTGSRCRRCW